MHSPRQTESPLPTLSQIGIDNCLKPADAASADGAVANGVDGGSRTLIVSHYLPFKCNLKNLYRVMHDNAAKKVAFGTGVWTFSKRRDHSALYDGILSLRETRKTIFIGSVDRVFEEAAGPKDDGVDASSLIEPMRRSMSQALVDQHASVPVFVSAAQSMGHYEGFCKICLWPLFHYLPWKPTDGRAEAQYWDAYVAVNHAFADQIVKVYKEGDHIWIHDYHLLLVPSMVRALLPNAIIGFFLHTPFPSSEIFRCLPKRKEVLQGVLGANLIGFQTEAYAHHFISSCTRILGVESTANGIDFKNSHVSIEICPIGIDADAFEASKNRSNFLAKMQAIRELYPGKKIIIGRDKLDDINGITHKLSAFESFLEEFPEWQDMVVLIQVTLPTEYTSKRLESAVSEMVSRINGHYGSLGFVPVHHYHHHIDKDEYYALLSIADVALITSIRDGMNTTPHEFVVCQQGNYGPLILSEFTGTAGSLSSAVLVNPWDYLGVASAINDALSMPKEEKMQKHQQLYQYVKTNTAKFWANSFLDALDASARIPEVSNPTPHLDLDSVVDKFTKAKKRIFFLDYDGTLTPIRKTPGAAVPPPRMLEALQILSADPNNQLWIVSGRDQAALDEWMGHIERLGFSAEHGCFLKQPRGEWVNLSSEIDLSWKDDVLPIFEYYTERTPGSFVEHKYTSLTWHYRLADPDFGSWQAKECHNHLENAILSKLPVEVLVGKKNLEVRPQAINKGEIVKRLMAQAADCDFIFCAGDDKTDEDMFRALRKLSGDEEHVVSCTIGSATKKTLARWHVTKSEDLVEVLAKLAGL